MAEWLSIAMVLSLPIFAVALPWIAWRLGRPRPVEPPAFDVMACREEPWTPDEMAAVRAEYPGKVVAFGLLERAWRPEERSRWEST